MNDRHAFRAKWHDYNDGIYFITICSNDKKHIFGKIENRKINYSPIGKIVVECIESIPEHSDNVEIWNYVVMPNHIHMVIKVGAQYFAPAENAPFACVAPMSLNIGCLKPPRHGDSVADNHFNSRLAVIIWSFKAACSILTKRYLRAQNIAPLQVWQRNYHEHIIRNQRAFDNIMTYIDNNIANWSIDCFNR